MGDQNVEAVKAKLDDRAKAVADLAIARSELSAAREQNQRLRACLQEACDKCRRCNGDGEVFGVSGPVKCMTCREWRAELAKGAGK